MSFSHKNITLTRGFVKAVHSQNPPDPMTPVFLQVLSIKQVNSDKGPSRYRLVISDGTNFMQSLLQTQLNDFVTNGLLTKNCLITTSKFIINNVADGAKKVVILLHLEPLTINEEIQKLGSPISIDAENQNAKNSAQAKVQQNVPNAVKPLPSGYQNQFAQSNTSRSSNSSNVNSSGPSIMPIKNLNPYQNRWTIKARVLTKSEIKTWSNAKGEGQLFSVTFSDESGEIRATGFKEAVTLFYELLQENQVYYISKCTIKAANKQFNTVNNDYEMTIDPSSEITLCNDGSDVPSIQYNALELSRLYEAENGANIDVLAVVKETGPLAEITTKAQKQLKKRELTLVDASGYAVRCTLWGRQAETFEHHDNPVLGIKGCKVGEFNGRSLSLSFGSSIQINPDLPEAHHLRGWFDSKGNTVDFQTYAGQSGQNGAGTNSTETKCISQVSEENLGMGDKPDYFMLTGYISHIKQDNAWYPACPNDTCNKKVTDMGNEWRCEKCDASYPTPKYRYILSLSVTDYSGQLWLQGFNEIAETILGQTANHMAQLKETSTPDYESVFGNALFKQFHFKVRAKSETYQDEVKMRASIVSVQPVDYVSSSKELIGMIQQFEKL